MQHTKRMTIDKKLFLYIFIGFILLTIVGVVSHEYAHYIVARLCGFKHAHTSYAYTRLSTANDTLIKSSINRSYTQSAKEQRPYLLTFMAGPIETIAVGTLGFILLTVHRRSFFKSTTLSLKQWVLVFLSLFWLRPALFLVGTVHSMSAATVLSTGKDEGKIARYLHINPLWVCIIPGIIGCSIITIVIIRYIPQKERFTFICAGIAGAIAGSWIWLDKFGPMIMP